MPNRQLAQLDAHYITWDHMTGIQKCITIAGSQKKVADFLGVTQQAVSEMEKKGYVPEVHVVGLSAEYGVPKKELINPRLRALLDEED